MIPLTRRVPAGAGQAADAHRGSTVGTASFMSGKRAAAASQGSAPRVALLTNFIAPYRVELYEALGNGLGRLRIYVSTRMEPNRPWMPQFGTLDVVVQRTLTFRWRLRRPGGIRQQLYIHVPVDTLARLLVYKPDLVISGELGSRSMQAVLYRLLRPHSRLILWATLSEHTEKDWGRIRTVLRGAILRHTDAVLVNGHSGLRYIRSLRPEVRVFIVNQPVPAEPFASVPLHRRPQDERRLVYSGRLIAQKGVAELQRAVIARCRLHPDQLMEIVWAGDGDMRGVLEATPLPANMRQFFTGHLDYPALARLYATCGALVLPTLFDEWGLVVNEALASGLPVIGSIFSQAVEELVDDSRTGWAFDPSDPGSLSRALDSFMNTPTETLAVMRGLARARVEQLTIARAADHISQVVASLLQEPATR